ncbi:TetR family transcriptional regulator [Gallaecimonas sp. GXIMD4217]|uniref:TetR family transcriptional regulator n=1 Tax=Gallaecimonas sp. GXIMD4217 TaxID=3131927 RepID=UPI00311ACC6E
MRRARTDQDKAQRRSQILATARQLLSEQQRLPTAAEIARAAGLAKGTVYLYFASKEAIFLALLEYYLLGWLTTLDNALARQAGLEELIDELVGYAEQRPAFCRLALLTQSVLEQGEDEAAILTFKGQLAGALGQAADRLGLERRQGAQLLQASYALLLGLWQAAHPPAVLDRLAADDRAVLVPDFASTARASLRALWQGLRGQEE